MKNALLIILLLQYSLFAYCSYDDCTMDVVSESISLSYDMYDEFEVINDELDELKDLYKNYSKVNIEQTHHIEQTHRVVAEYLLVLKEISLIKKKIRDIKTNEKSQ